GTTLSAHAAHGSLLPLAGEGARRADEGGALRRKGPGKASRLRRALTLALRAFPSPASGRGVFSAAVGAFQLEVGREQGQAGGQRAGLGLAAGFLQVDARTALAVQRGRLRGARLAPDPQHSRLRGAVSAGDSDQIVE